VEDVNLVTGDELNSPYVYLIFLNGLIIGAHPRPLKLVEKVIKWSLLLLLVVISCTLSHFIPRTLSVLKYIFRTDFISLCCYVTNLQSILALHQIRKMRRNGRIGEFVSVYLNVVQKAVYVASDGGRVCRPLLIVENGKILLTQKHIQRLGKSLELEDLLADGIIEYVDVRDIFLSSPRANSNPENSFDTLLAGP
jgi:hypothetical protein